MIPLALSLTLLAPQSIGPLPPGFRIELFAGPELANDIQCLHIDEKGRVIVGGRGYIRQLVDSKGTGKADKAIELVAPPKDGPMGLLWEGETLYAVCDGGLQRYTGVTGIKPGVRDPQPLVKLKTGGEHDAHAVKRGPDGKLWWLVGNMAGVNAKTITKPEYELKDPTAGVLLKLDDSGKDVTAVADGFRNAYDFDFDLGGTPFTFDSDQERDLGLPWYEPCRFYKVRAGGNSGWLSPQHAQFWRKPSYFIGVVAPVLTAGRGSPTGVACYRHTQFPKEYQGGFFFADWTFGTIWFADQTAKDPKPIRFYQPTGEDGFAPTGLAVNPITGDLYVSIGGRGTRGAVYRIFWSHANGKEEALAYDLTPKVEKPQRAMQESVKGEMVDPKFQGTVWEGYSYRHPIDPAKRREYFEKLLGMKGYSGDGYDFENLRFLAAFEDYRPETLDNVSKKLSSLDYPIQSVHQLICLARFTAPRTPEITSRIAKALVGLDAAYVKVGELRDRHWPLRLSEVAAELTKRDPKLPDAILKESGFGIAEHVWLAKAVGLKPNDAAQAFLKHSKSEKDFAWTAGHVEFLAALPEAEWRELVPKLWDLGLRDSVILQLAKSPRADDATKFQNGLASANSSVALASAKALKMTPTTEKSELVLAIKALRRFADAKKDAEVRKALFALLEVRTQQKFETLMEWEAWLEKAEPKLFAQLGSPGVDAAKWKAKLETISWDQGDRERGAKVFAKAQCAACHNGGQAVGPSLQGVAQRFGRSDLFTAIYDPSRDISPRYRTVKFTTTDEKVFEGIVIYDAVDGVMLQTGADATVRIPGKSIQSRMEGKLSLMPTGLLDALSESEIADLDAYLRSLK